jgi:hypothetical protein
MNQQSLTQTINKPTPPRRRGRFVALLLVLTMLTLTGLAQAASIWQIETVDSAGNEGLSPSLALDSSGRPHISYGGNNSYDLKYAAWDGSSWQIETVDDMGDREEMDPSLALDSSGRPHISYLDGTTYDLKYTAWDGSSWQIETVDSAGDVGRDPSVALDSSDRPHISYYDISNQGLKYAAWDGSSWQIETVDSVGGVDYSISLALDSSGRPHISYLDGSNFTLKYAAWDGSSWQIETVDSVGGVDRLGYDTTLALDSNGRPHISYYDADNADLKYAAWDGSSWQIETVDSAGSVGWFSSLALDSNGRPHISYYDDSNSDLKYATWNDSSWQIQTVDSDGLVGGFTSLALDSNGNLHISYTDVDDIDLKYAFLMADNTPPTVRVTGVEEGASYDVNAVPAAGCDTQDDLSGVATEASLTISGGDGNGLGLFTATCDGATDNAGNTADPVSVSYTVTGSVPDTYDFHGFLPLVYNPPTVNLRLADQRILLRFSLNGDQGRDIFADGYPASQQIDCDTLAPIGEIEPTHPTGKKGLAYNRFTDRYVYVWNTDRDMKHTCRQFILGLDDGSQHIAYFKFK